MSDGTVRLLKKWGIPVTRENYLRLACAGNPPDEIDGEVEAELDRVRQSLPGGDWEATTLPLTRADRRWLRKMGVAQ